jgi:hypothetical protein
MEIACELASPRRNQTLLFHALERTIYRHLAEKFRLKFITTREREREAIVGVESELIREKERVRNHLPSRERERDKKWEEMDFRIPLAHFHLNKLFWLASRSFQLLLLLLRTLFTFREEIFSSAAVAFCCTLQFFLSQE